MTRYFDVILTNAGGSQIGVMKELASLLDLGLKEAKTILAALPAKIVELPLDEANALVARFEALGAQATLVRTSRFDVIDGAAYRVVLVDAGARLDDIAEAVETITGAEVDSERRATLEWGNSTVADALSPGAAAEAVKLLEAAGGRVYVEGKG